jgi:serine/threonine protein kinase
MGNDQGDASERRKILHTTCGTPNYVCPEVLESRGYDGCKADVWSIGVVLYTLLSGLLPFEEETIAALFAKIKSAQYTTPSSLSPEAKDLISRILVADPDKRITLAEMSNHPWMLGPTKSPGITPPSKTPKEKKCKHHHHHQQQQLDKSRARNKAGSAVDAAGPGTNHGHATTDDEHKRQRECGGGGDDENTDTSNKAKGKSEEEEGSSSSGSHRGSCNHRARDRNNHQQHHRGGGGGGGDSIGLSNPAAAAATTTTFSTDGVDGGLPQPPLPPEMSEEQRDLYGEACSPDLVNALEIAVSRALTRPSPNLTLTPTAPSEEEHGGFVPASNNSINNKNNTLSLLDPNTLPAVDSDTGSGGRGQARQQTAVESAAASSSVVIGNGNPHQQQQQQHEEDECKEGLSAAAAVSESTTTTTATVGAAVTAKAKPVQELQQQDRADEVGIAHQGCAACVIS